MSIFRIAFSLTSFPHYVVKIYPLFRTGNGVLRNRCTLFANDTYVIESIQLNFKY